MDSEHFNFYFFLNICCHFIFIFIYSDMIWIWVKNMHHNGFRAIRKQHNIEKKENFGFDSVEMELIN